MTNATDLQRTPNKGQPHRRTETRMSEEQAARIRIAPPLYSNISEFAAILDLSPWKVRDLIRKRRIPALVIGGRIVIETNRALESLRQQFEQKAV